MPTDLSYGELKKKAALGKKRHNLDAFELAMSAVNASPIEWLIVFSIQRSAATRPISSLRGHNEPTGVSPNKPHQSMTFLLLLLQTKGAFRTITLAPNLFGGEEIEKEMYKKNAGLALFKGKQVLRKLFLSWKKNFSCFWTEQMATDVQLPLKELGWALAPRKCETSAFYSASSFIS